jgi:hypothetical protein
MSLKGMKMESNEYISPIGNNKKLIKNIRLLIGLYSVSYLWNRSRKSIHAYSDVATNDGQTK